MAYRIRAPPKAEQQLRTEPRWKMHPDDGVGRLGSVMIRRARIIFALNNNVQSSPKVCERLIFQVNFAIN